MFNHKCLNNAVEYALTHKHTIVVEVIIISNNNPILHYINYNVKKEVFLETTLGYKSSEYDYYLLQYIEEKDFENITTSCHTSNKVRGLLCNGCNKGIGLLKENIKTLENAIKYLEEHNNG